MDRYHCSVGCEWGLPGAETPVTPDELDVLDGGDAVEGAGGDALMSGGRKSEQPILSMQDIHSLSEKHLLPVAHCGIVSIMASCDKEL